MTKLKRCPFCGGKANLRVYSANLQFVQCVDCLSGTNAFPTDEEAIEAWNKRNTLLGKVKKEVKKWLKNWLKD